MNTRTHTPLSTALSVIVAAVLLGAACDQGPTAPTGASGLRNIPDTNTSPTGNSPAVLPPAKVSFPPLSGPSRTFVFDRELSYPVHDFTRQSRFVLYDNGAFGLHYASSASVLGGAYQNANGVLMFLFASTTDRTVDEAWDDATGTLQGDSLTIEYDEIMQHSDFEDAVYVLVAGSS